MTTLEMLGRRFEFADKRWPDVTVAGMDRRANTVCLNLQGAATQTVPLDAFELAYKTGDLLEAAAAPFGAPCKERTGLRTYIAGPHKRPMRGYPVIG